MLRAIRMIGVNLGVAGEFLSFLWHHKRWWLIPMGIVLLFFALLLIFASVTGLGPFIYTIF